MDISSNAFRVVLPNTSSSNQQIQKSISINENEEKIILMFKKQDVIRRADVEKAISVSQPMAVKLLKSLLDKSFIIRLGQGKNVTYRPNSVATMAAYKIK